MAQARLAAFPASLPPIPALGFWVSVGHFVIFSSKLILCSSNEAAIFVPVFVQNLVGLAVVKCDILSSHVSNHVGDERFVDISGTPAQKD